MRYPAVAGRFYPLDRDELLNSIENCFEHKLGPGNLGGCMNERRIKAVLVPHAGYMASGMNAAHAFKALHRDGKPEAYIIVGPDHYGVPFNSVLCSESYLTPLGECRVDLDIAGKLGEYIPDCSNAHMREHSVEVEIPFLQYIDPGAKIVPIIMSRQNKESAVKLADAIRKATKGRDVAIIASSDLCHYIPDRMEKNLDSEYLSKISELDVDGMYGMVHGKGLSVCGYGPTAVAIMASGCTECKILSHINSWDSLEYDRNAVVGYGSAVFY